MSGTSSKEDRRNLRKEMGAVAAAAVVDLQGIVRTVQLEHRTLARQMLDFEATVATVRAGRTTDQARVVALGARLDELAEQLEALTARNAALDKRIDDALARLRRTWWRRWCEALS